METAMNDLSGQARALIDVARTAEDPSAQDQARVRRALMMRVAGVTAATTLGSSTAAGAAAAGGAVGAATAGLAGIGWVGKTLIVAALGVAVTGGALVVTGHTPWSSHRLPEQPANERPLAGVELAAPNGSGTDDVQTPNRAVSDPVADEPMPKPLESAAPPPVLAATRTISPEASSSAPRAPGSVERGPDIEAELRLLREAQTALGSGRAERALEILDLHQSTFATGALREERMAARVFALCDLGRVEQARVEAARFLLEAPGSPLAARVRAACGTTP
jgi:hypothetical protein